MAFSNENEGFTIVEVLVVLAVTTMLLSVSLLGQGGIREQAQFRDGTEQLLSEIERVKGEMNTTVNATRNTDCTLGNSPGNQAGTNQACLVFAKAITFNQDQSTYQIQTFIADNTLDSSIVDIQTNSGDPNLSSTGEISWGIEFKEVINPANPSDTTPVNYNTIVFSRNMNNGSLETRVMPFSEVDEPTSYTVSSNYTNPYSFVFEDPEGLRMQINVNANDQLNTLSKDIL